MKQAYNRIELGPDFIPVPTALGYVEVSLVCQSNLICNNNLFNDSGEILRLVAHNEFYQELLKHKVVHIYEVGNYQRLQQMLQQQKLDAVIMVFDLNTQDIPSLQLNT
ncbi:MAG: hypothetical protein ACJAXM_000195 [Arenicella sp.]